MKPEGKDEKTAALPSAGKYFFSISGKIWLSLSILIIGYAAWMITGFFRGQETLSHLTLVHEQIFPAAIQSKMASTDFNEQIRMYKEAVVFGKTELLEEAKARADGAQNALKQLVQLVRYDKRKITEARVILKQLRDFTAEAYPLYKKMASEAEDISSTVTGKAAQLNRDSEAIKQGLIDLTDSFSDSLKEELGLVSKETRFQQYLDILIFFIAVVVSLFVVKLIISQWITRPLIKAAALARTMAEGNLSLKLDVHQHDEIGELAHAMNVMAGEVEKSHTLLAQENIKLEKEIAERKKTEAELEAAHKKLVKMARVEGRAEVTASVLHNVGNVITSVNVTANWLKEEIRYSKIPNFVKAAGILTEHKHDLAEFLTKDKTGRKLPVYLAALAKHLEEERKDFSLRLKELCSHVKIITELIAVQQAPDSAAGLTEVVSVAELLENAFQVNAPSMTAHGIEIVRKFENTPTCRLDHNKFMQIIINLLSNAKDALKESNNTPKTIKVGLKNKGDNRILVEVADNGIGIPKENINKVFELGFTTRKKGHGFGLHIAAIHAMEMGGTLTPYSAGPGKGAVFTLELPLRNKSKGVNG
jgi:signal transduction histidine kinase